MDSHVYRKASYRLPALAGIAVLRFNTRGTVSPRGTSDGAFEEGIGERLDVEAAVQFAVDRGLPNRWLVGWSFGTELALMYGAVGAGGLRSGGRHPALAAAAPGHGRAPARNGRPSGKPLKVLVPEHDDYLQPAAAAERFGLVPQARVVGVDGAKHLWVGEKYAGRVLNEIVDEVTAGRAPAAGTGLPQEWDGPVATAHA